MGFYSLAPETPQTQICAACGMLIDIHGCEPLSRIGCPRCRGELIVKGTIDHFELLDVAGRGGTGVVYKARDLTLDRLVALKLLRKDRSNNAQFMARLEREAVITASISHPCVVSVFSTGTDHGRLYIAMELVGHGSLDDLIRVQGRVSEAQTLQVGIQIAQGLRAAHQHGLIHRDVKPGNILFADAHTAKIVDFGLAIFAEQEESLRGEIWGTPYYVAPEKLQQKREDFRSDIYSLGSTLFHALAGRPPFDAESTSLVALKHVKTPAISVRTLSPHISGACAYVIDRALNKDPNQRYQSYDELIQHLEYARTELIKALRERPPRKRAAVPNAPIAWVWVSLAMLVGLALIGAVVFALQ